MFQFSKANANASILKAIDKSYAWIEFTPKGDILSANSLFLDTMGYTEREIKGKHHQIFVDPDYAQSGDYDMFWRDLAAGRPQQAEFCRYTKDGIAVWIQATYIPIMNGGRVNRVIKLAQDITPQKEATANTASLMSAMDAASAVIEFDMTGTILSANQNFLDTMGYAAEDIIGQHHRMFADPDYAASTDYAAFWQALRAGQKSVGEYLRYGKNKKEVWISASYNPILDAQGRPFKVVKFASDITATRQRAAYVESLEEAIDANQAMIEFHPDGTIIKANDIFLETTGYALAEIQGKHHSIFVPDAIAASEDYRQFWQDLGNGIPNSSEFHRRAKDGSDIWLQAIYNPIKNSTGVVYKVVKIASDITELTTNRLRAASLSQEVKGSIQSVAGASEEMLASINEIGQSMRRSQSRIDDIIEKNTEADKLATKMQENATSMETIAEMIRSISDKVNILSMNAIIESARAGQAGKGFAVVAGEVKNLANATARATEQISSEIAAIQQTANNVKQSGVVIAESTRDMGEVVSSITAAMEQQSAATQEVSMNMSQISDGVVQLDDCIDRMAASCENPEAEETLPELRLAAE